MSTDWTIERLDALPERFRSKIRIDDPPIPFRDSCWTWTAHLDRKGYGRFQERSYVSARAHRFSYEALVGPIPGDLTIDHLCSNKACVNPAHMEPVTNAENVRRSRGSTEATFSCGHPRSEENSVPTSAKPYTAFKCRMCKNRGDRSRRMTEGKTPPAMKRCGVCDLTMPRSSYARHQSRARHLAAATQATGGGSRE